jgi:hypothetical protein
MTQPSYTRVQLYDAHEATVVAVKIASQIAHLFKAQLPKPLVDALDILGAVSEAGQVLCFTDDGSRQSAQDRLAATNALLRLFKQP